MAIVDETIVAVALPSIQEDLGFSQSGLAWVTGAYLVAFAGLLLLSGRLGDLLGRRSVFLVGIGVFTAASMLAGVAWSPAVLIGARFVQGLGAAALSAVILGMIVTLFTDQRERATAIGAFSFVQASGGSIGTIAGGVITDVASWHWAFFVNVPIGLTVIVLAVRVVPHERGLGLGRGADIVGAGLVTAGLMSGVTAIIGVEQHGWGSAYTIGFGMAALILLAGFVWRAGRAANPLLPLRIFASRRVSTANVVIFLLVGALFGWMFLTALFIQQVLGFEPGTAGLAMVPTAVSIAIVSLGMSARVITRFGERPVLLAGLTMIMAGLLYLSRMPSRIWSPRASWR